MNSIVSDQQIDIVTPAVQPKIMYAGNEPAGQPYIAITDSAIGLIGDPNHGIIVNPDFGVGIVGPMSFMAGPEQISFSGGYWRVNPQVLSSIGSMSATPVPFLIPGTPALLQAASDIDNCMNQMEGYAGF
jgi:hypothetical protein